MRRDSDFSLDEIIDHVKLMVETYFPDHSYSEDNLYYWGVLDGGSGGSGSNPKVTENKEAIIKDGIESAFLYESDTAGRTENDAYLLLDPRTLSGTLVKGLGRSITDPDYEHLAGWFPAYTYESVERFDIDDVPDQSYKLYDREVSLSEAVEFSTDFFENKYIPASFTPVDTKVAAIEVMRFKDLYGYRLLLKNFFDDIPFDYVFDLTTSSMMSDNKDYITQMEEAFMAKSNDIDFWYTTSPYTQIERDGEALTRILSLEDAVDIISTKLSDAVSFEAESMEFVYCPLSYDFDSADPYVTTAEAAWKMNALNSNDGKMYCVYVNAVTGELRYYTRTINN